MAEDVEPIEAPVGGFRPKQPEQFLAVDVSASGRRRGGYIDYVVRELRVKLARDSEITGDDPIQFHLYAVGRELTLVGDP